MNKNDIILIIVILFISLIFFLNHFNNDKVNEALVYHENNLILTIDLTIDNTYTVDGDNGKVIIEVYNNQIKVSEETSSYHLCSKQGYINKSGEVIICLPNKITIQIPGDSKLDTEVK